MKKAPKILHDELDRMFDEICKQRLHLDTGKMKKMPGFVSHNFVPCFFKSPYDSLKIALYEIDVLNKTKK